MSKYILLFSVTLLVGLIGCRANTDSPPASGTAPLVAIPLPDFERMEPLVREQLQAAQDSLDAALAGARPAPAPLSRLFGTLGRQYQAYGYDEAARACFLNARKLDPQAFEWFYYLGHLLQKVQPEESIAQFEQALALNPDYLPTYIALAEGYLADNRLDEAEVLLKKARAMEEANASVLIGLGELASLRKDHEAAITYLEAARRLAPEATRIYYPLGMAYRAQGNQDKALHFLAQRGGGREPLDDPLLDEVQALTTGGHAFKLRGNRAYLAGRFEEARAAYEQAIEADPDNPESYTNLAVTLVALNQVDAAEQLLKEAVRLSPERSVTLFNLASLLAKQDRNREALPYYERALHSNPDHVGARFNMANAYFRLGQYEAAATHYERVVALDPQNRNARLQQALALARSGQWAPALAALEAGHAAHPGDAGIAWVLAQVLAACPEDRLRDGPRALALADRLTATAPTLEYVETRAMALAAVGRFDEAADLQAHVLASAQQADRADLEDRLQTNLSRYRKGQPAEDLASI